MRFNTQAVDQTKTTNIAGGAAYALNRRMQFATLLLTSLLQDKFYKTATEELATLQQLLGAMTMRELQFAAKAAVYARNTHGLRSITHVVAGEIAKLAKGQTWTRTFFQRVFKRPDDMMETVAYYQARYPNTPLPNSLKDGIARTISQLDEYTLAKYRGEGKSIKMIDLVNLTHPKSTDAISKLVKGTLRNVDTWEAKVSAAGGDKEATDAAWEEMLTNGKLGYFALLRNLRNIEQRGNKAMIDAAVLELLNVKKIKKSLVLPFQYMKAIENVTDPKLMRAVNAALEIALDNCPTFDGKTLVLLDCSGSMNDNKVWTTATLFAAMIAKRSDADLVVFAQQATRVPLIATDSLFGIQKQIPFHGGGTNLTPALVEAFQKPYDRIFLLSDMQCWGQDGYYENTWYNQYKARWNFEVPFYSIDLMGHGTSQLSGKHPKVYTIAGISEKVFDLVASCEKDRDALISEIESISFDCEPTKSETAELSE